jgi:hypothetical protein
MQTNYVQVDREEWLTQDSWFNLQGLSYLDQLFFWEPGLPMKLIEDSKQGRYSFLVNF